MSKSRSNEKMMILDSVSRRPYGTKLSVLLDDSTRMMLHGDACLLTDTDYIIKVRPIKSQDPGQVDTVSWFRKWEIFVEGFDTAGEAEKEALKWHSVYCGGGNLRKVLGSSSIQDPATLRSL